MFCELLIAWVDTRMRVLRPLYSTAKQRSGEMAEDKGLEPDDAQYSEEEALIYISDEKHPTGSVKKAELRR